MTVFTCSLPSPKAKGKRVEQDKVVIECIVVPLSLLRICCSKKLEDRSEYQKMPSEDDEEKTPRPGSEDSEQPVSVVEAPKVGMSFGSDEEIRCFYMKYGSHVGFAIRRACTKIGDDGKLKYFSFSCSRSRKPTYTSKNSFRLRPSMRTDCKAKINIVVANDGSLVISKVRLDHNHPLTPGIAQHVKCKKDIENHAHVRLQPIRELSSKSLIKVKPPIDEIRDDDIPDQSRQTQTSLLYTTCSLKLHHGDSQAIQDYFIRMQQNNDNFFYIMDLREDGCLRNVFWADSRSREAYKAFGDVILFDTTFLTNSYDVPFVAFFGVDHHGYSILLGSALLSSKHTETYVWLFNSWLRCMSGASPEAIFTERDQSIQEAVSLVFPHARYRLCLWHIMKGIRQQLESLNQTQEINMAIQSVIYGSLRPNDFEESWVKIIHHHNLVNNEWFKSLFADRQQWAPVFVKEHFWAGISTTQCCENMNAFFDGFVHSKTSLKWFLEQYNAALRNKIEKENKADIISSTTSLPLFSDLHLETQFQEAYTHEMFKLLQDEIKGLLYCNTSFLKSDQSISTYEVTDSVKVMDDAPRKEISFHVLYNEEGSHLRCFCLLFEFRGILCKHAISVLVKRNMHKIPSHYILSRWRNDIMRRHTLMKSSSFDDIDSNTRMGRYDQLCKHMHQIAEHGAESKDKFKFLMECLDETKEKLLNNNWICLPAGKRKDPLTEQITNKKKKKHITKFQTLGKQIQAVDDGGGYLNGIGSGGRQRDETTPKANPSPSWIFNASTPASHQLFLQNHMFQEQPRDAGFVEFGNNCTHWLNPGILQHGGGLQSDRSGDNHYIGEQNRCFGPTQTTSTVQVGEDPNSNFGSEQDHVSNDTATL